MNKLHSFKVGYSYHPLGSTAIADFISESMTVLARCAAHAVYQVESAVRARNPHMVIGCRFHVAREDAS